MRSQPCLLGWANIESTLVSVMREQRVSRLEAERRAMLTRRYATLREVVDSYLDNLPHNVVGPGRGDIVATEAFTSIFLAIPMEEELTAEHFTDAIAQIPQFSEDWRIARDLELVELLKPQRPAATTADLSLAVTRFRCKCCMQSTSYPSVLLHRCTQNYNLSNFDKKIQDIVAHVSGAPWITGSFVLDAKISNLARTIVLGCELDPETASMEEMDTLNPLLVSPSSGGPYNGRSVTRWKGLVCCQLLLQSRGSLPV